MKVAVIGSTGQLGSDVVRVLEQASDYRVHPLGPGDVECADPQSVRLALEMRPDVVVNCAAFVRVDDCEESPEEAFRVNALGALYVARACAALRAVCVYISTDYVFEGERGEPYTEDDQPRPINVYGASKLAGEYLVQQACSDWLIVRVASLFGKAGARSKGGNFVETIIRKAQGREPLRVVNDVWMSPTYACDAAQVLERLIRKGARGIFHGTNAGACTWYDFAKKVLDLAGLDTPLDPIPSSEYPTKARRPKNSSLVSVRLPSLLNEGCRPWVDALEAYLIERGLARHERRTGCGVGGSEEWKALSHLTE